MHLLVHFMIFQREGVSCPAPTGGTAGQCLAHVCNGPDVQRPVHTSACTGLAKWLTPYTSRANSAGVMR